MIMIMIIITKELEKCLEGEGTLIRVKRLQITLLLANCEDSPKGNDDTRKLISLTKNTV